MERVNIVLIDFGFDRGEGGIYTLLFDNPQMGASDASNADSWTVLPLVTQRGLLSPLTRGTSDTDSWSV
jgi:hypothetical protein